MKKLLKSCLWMFLTTLLVQCEQGNEDFSRPSSMEFESAVECEGMPRSIVASMENGNMTVLFSDANLENPVVRLERIEKSGQNHEILVDFLTFSQGDHVMYLPTDLALDQGGFLWVLARPVTDSSGGILQTANGFCILEFTPDGDFIREMDYSTLDGGYPSNLACNDGSLFVEYGRELMHIKPLSGDYTSITIPTEPTDDLMARHSDLEISDQEMFYFASGSIPHPDSSACRVSSWDMDADSISIDYSMGKTLVMASMIGAPGLGIHQNGNIYLATFYGCSVEIYDDEMNFLLERPLEKTGERDPLPIDLDTWKDRVYVADYANRQVQIYTIHQ